MKTITAKDILKTFQENLQKVKQNEVKSEKDKLDINGNPKEIMSRGLRVRHRESGLEYTVISSDKNKVRLSTPEKQPFEIDMTEFKAYYQVD